jgi:hypothetical protein
VIPSDFEVFNLIPQYYCSLNGNFCKGGNGGKIGDVVDYLDKFFEAKGGPP